MTDHSNQSGGFISSAWPTYYQATQVTTSTGTDQAIPSPPGVSMITKTFLSKNVVKSS